MLVLTQSDEHFLEASGILDSIQQVMNDFIVSSAPEQDAGQIIIGDDVIAEIREGIERKEAAEARRLRQLRSLSDFNESSEAGCVCSRVVCLSMSPLSAPETA